MARRDGLAQIGQNTRHRVLLPKAPHRVTQHASRPSFAALTNVAQIGQEKTAYPFADLATKERYELHYEPSSQACIAAALKAGIQAKQSSGTSPELVVLGFYMTQAVDYWQLDRNLLWQSQGFDIFHRYRPFTVDIAVIDNGLYWFYPVDGVEFHEATMLQIVRDMQRDKFLQAKGEVVAIPDRECVDVARLTNWLRQHGAPG